MTRFFFSRYTVTYLRGGLLLRPLGWVVALGLAGALLSWAEERWPALNAWLPVVLFPSRNDPQMAQMVLSTVATSIMTVVGIVFAILLMTLTLASMQFSPRILANFVRDRVTQVTLGLFLGTFTYCLAALPAARNLPVPFAPVLTVAGAMVLALCCAGWLLYFMHHISMAISASHIVDQLAGETCAMVEAMMPAQAPALQPAPPSPLGPALDICTSSSGYVRFVDVESLAALAIQHGLHLKLLRRVGDFALQELPLLRVQPVDAGATLRDLDGLRRQALDCIELGPTRTLQQDIEFGILQIVDIALKALSPAVNDPSTAIACVDQLSRVLVHALGRQPTPAQFVAADGVARVEITWPDLHRLLEAAFEQIRLYARADLAVSMRLLKALAALHLRATQPEDRALIAIHAERVVSGCRGTMTPLELLHLEARWLELMPGAGPQPDS